MGLPGGDRRALEPLASLVEGDAAGVVSDEVEAEGTPAIDGHQVALGRGVTLDGEHARLAVDVRETEVDERMAEPRTHPQGADVAVFVDLENEEPARHLRVVAGGLDDAHKHVGAAIAVDVARLETVDGIGQGPTFDTTGVVGHLHVVKRVRDGDEA